ncbi:hypothetical protein DV515_00007621, partial [Chloebia gouldiae]
MLDIEAGRVSIYYHQPHFIRIKQQLKGLEDGGESQVLTDSEGGVTSQRDVTLGRRSGEEELILANLGSPQGLLGSPLCQILKVLLLPTAAEPVL